jgi:hypothetical protein
MMRPSHSRPLTLTVRLCKLAAAVIATVAVWRVSLMVAGLLLGSQMQTQGESDVPAAVVAGLASAAQTPPAPEPRRVRQAVHEYFSIFAGGKSPEDHEKKMNPFVAYTNLGTDFGFIGASQETLDCDREAGMISIKMPQGQWAGMWHGLAGLGGDLDQTLDFRACYPEFIKAEYQPRIIGVEFRARGKGAFKLEVKSADQKTLWQRALTIDSPDVRTFVEPLDPVEIGRAKFLNWVAEGGTEASLDSIAFILQAPAIPFDEYVFLSSYAKLARCFSAKTGYMKDRAHLSDAIFDNVPACGLFALGTALAANKGMVPELSAREILHRVNANVSQLDTAQGILPHFVRRAQDGRYGIMPGTEFSTVDSSIYFHAMLLAAEMLQDKDVTEGLTKQLQGLSFERLVDGEGYIRHGIRDDKLTLLPSAWRDWGGETALVLSMVNMSGKPTPPRMMPTGRVYDGTGFIAEIQSLFFPDFDSEQRDQVSKQNWLGARQSMLAKQKEYFLKNWPDSRAAQLGFYGLSAGEARHGMGYMVSGVDLPQQSFIHPHYVLMSGCLEPDPKTVYALLRRMEDERLFPPWGMVEHFMKEVDEYLAMQGALNAGFECLGAYHLMAKHRGTANALYDASRTSEIMRRGISIFYPAQPASVVESKTGSALSVR